MLPPVDGEMYITSLFGFRADPVDGNPDVHGGIDFRAEIGDDVKSQWHGEVTKIYTTEGGGLTVEVEHGSFLTTKYLHLSEVLVQVGDKVNQYDIIAKAGDSGRVTGPHLHFEVYLDDGVINPVLLYGNRGAKAFKNYMISNDAYTEDNQELLKRIKERPTKIAEDLKEQELVESRKELVIGERPVDYTRVGEVPEGSISLQMEYGFQSPKPSSEILDLEGKITEEAGE